MMRFTLLLSGLFLLQSCAVTERFFPGDKEEVETSEAPALLDNTNPDRKWFCYGKSADEPWDCQNTEDTSKISAVGPKSTNGRTKATRQRIEPRPVGAPTPAPAMISTREPVPEVSAVGQDDETSTETVEKPNSTVVAAVKPQATPEPATLPKPPQESRDDQVADRQPIITEAVADTVEATPEPVTVPLPVTEPAPAPSSNVSTQTVFAQEILDSPSRHYAVQLIALRDLDGIVEYANLNGIENPFYVKIRNDQTDWFILLLGIYPERTLAEAARQEWQTAKVLRVQPWIRQLGGLQEAIRKADG